MIFFLLIFASISFAQNQDLQQGDFYYALRAENSKDNMAGDENIKESINHYNLALKDSNAKQEAAWKLLRAYYFLGCFATPNLKKNRIQVFEKAKKEGRSFFDAYPKNAEIAYWYSVNLALWSSLVNPAIAIKAGSVKETREIAKMLIAREATNKETAARGHQILGKAHQKLPHIVFVSSWVDRDSAEYHFKKSISLNPNDLATRLFLAEYYKENSREQEMEELLKPALGKHPKPEHFLEDERNLIKMKKLLRP
jgi:tetratricopeptide (TPR) repeat protein